MEGLGAEDRLPTPALFPCCADLLGERIRPGQELFKSGLVVRFHVRKSAEHVFQIPLRIKPGRLCCLHQAPHFCGRSCLQQRVVRPAPFGTSHSTFVAVWRIPWSTSPQLPSSSRPWEGKRLARRLAPSVDRSPEKPKIASSPISFKLALVSLVLAPCILRIPALA